MPKRKYKTVGLLANSSKVNVPAAAKQLADQLHTLGVKVLLEKGNRGLRLVRNGHTVSTAAMGEQADLLVSLGGDGTLLRAAAVVRGKQAPLLGINLGTLGFMTALRMEEMDEALPKVLAGRFRVDKRSMVEGRIVHGQRIRKRVVALNELLVAKGFPGRVAELLCEVDGKELAVYRADGLIIASPTGSTAYALSVGGPILDPRLKTLLLAPISPHALSNRPLVIPDGSVVRVTVHSRRDPVFVAADGQERVALRAGEVLEVRRAKEKTRLLVPPGSNYFELLRRKLGWRGK